jgi:hypothetical protein
VLGAGIAIVAAAGLTACGSSGHSSSAPAASASTTASSAANAPSGMARGHGVFGKIATENPGTWTITKRDGSTETVTITPTTVFGSKQQPETQSQFAVGDPVMIRGQVSGDTITATRISQPHARSNGAAPTTTSTN